MNGRVDDSEVLYDYRNTEAARRRKERAVMWFKREMKKAFTIFFLIDLFVTLFVIIMVSNSRNIIITFTVILMFYWLLIPVHLIVYYRWRNYKNSASLDVIVTRNGIFMEHWDHLHQPGKLRFYPWKYIDRIYWNEGSRQGLIIKSELGWRRTDRRYRYEPLIKTNIDNLKEFKEALKQTTRLIENKKKERIPLFKGGNEEINLRKLVWIFLLFGLMFFFIGVYLFFFPLFEHIYGDYGVFQGPYFMVLGMGLMFFAILFLIAEKIFLRSEKGKMRTISNKYT